jgi:hypothetical protein
LDGPTFAKAILVTVHKIKNNSLKAICQKLSKELEAGFEEEDGPIISNSLRGWHFRDESYKRIIDGLEVVISIVKIFAKRVEVILNDRLTFLQKEAAKPSGPGARAEGGDDIMLSILATEKGERERSPPWEESTR